MQTTALVMKPMDWAPLQDIDDVEPINDGDTACLQAVYDVLKQHGMQDRFGVTLIHKHFDMADDEVLLEQTNAAERRLVLAPAKLDSQEVSRSVQTSWMFGEMNGQIMRVCNRRCFTNVWGTHSDGGHYSS